MTAQGHEDLSRTHEIKGSSNRAFGGVFVGLFAIIGVWPLLFGGAVRWWSMIISIAILVITLLAPKLLTIPNRLWMRFGLLLNRIISPVALGLLFYFVVTPMGALMRVFGKDNLRLRHASDTSYWIKRDPPGPKPDSLNHQF
ncbi:MAG TPA: SxtJ family membrane protein [Burkholderiales bacterium]|nr:SxtJ family membrane protein [Burkholderiales bacterium]